MKLTAAEKKEVRLKRKFVSQDRHTGKYFVTDKWSRAFYPCTQTRLNQVAHDNHLAIRIKSKRSPRLAIITRPNGKTLQTDRLWSLTECLQEAAEIIHTLQALDRGGKIRYYSQLGL